MKQLLSPDRVAQLLGTNAQKSQKHQRSQFDRLKNLKKHARKVLSDDDVRAIRKRYEAQEKLASIASEFGVSIPCICMIGTRARRNDVPDRAPKK